MHPDALFITGTDTGVGKTVVGAAIASLWKDRGLRVAAFKPIETGGSASARGLCDAEMLLRASSLSTQSEVCLYQLDQPLAPAVAAEMQGVDIDVDRIVQHFHRLKEQHDAVVVEGAGGLMVPVRWDYLFLHLIRELALPVVVVARAGLGTINHTLLTCHALTAHDVKIFAIILNRCGFPPDLAEQTNPAAVRRLSGCDRVLVLPELEAGDDWTRAQSLKPFLREMF